MRLFTRKELTIFLSVFLSVLVLSLVIAVSVSLAKRKTAGTGADTVKADSEKALGFDDFLIPEEYRTPWYMDITPSREPVERWDEATAQRFRQDVSGIVLDIIREENTNTLLEGR